MNAHQQNNELSSIPNDDLELPCYVLRPLPQLNYIDTYSLTSPDLITKEESTQQSLEDDFDSLENILSSLVDRKGNVEYKEKIKTMLQDGLRSLNDLPLDFNEDEVECTQNPVNVVLDENDVAWGLPDEEGEYLVPDQVKLVFDSNEGSVDESVVEGTPDEEGEGLGTIDSSNEGIVETNENTQEVYREIKGFIGDLGGGGSGEAIYGEMTEFAMQRVVNTMKTECEFTKDSIFLDIGSGVGKPSLHVTQDPGVRLSMGIELKKERCFLSQNVLLRLLKNNDKRNINLNNIQRCWFKDGNILEENSINPATHVYSFDIGWLDKEYCWVAYLFNTSLTCRWYICYKKPHEMESFGFQVELVSTLTGMSQHGSNSKAYPCYFYKKKDMPRESMTGFEKIQAFLDSSSTEEKIDTLEQSVEELGKHLVSPRKAKVQKCYRCMNAIGECTCRKKSNGKTVKRKTVKRKTVKRKTVKRKTRRTN